MNVNEPPIIRWYAATIILRCTINGKDGNPWSGVDRNIPSVQREVMLLRAHSADAAYDLALERGRTRGWGYDSGTGMTVLWAFAGLEDIQELDARETLDGLTVWSRCVTGLSADALIYSKDDLSIFCPERGFFISPADRHDLNESKSTVG